MKRRDFLIASAAALIVPGAARAGAVEERIIAMLTEQGYLEIRLTRTWLGRIRIVAIGPKYRREIILNRKTGEILRDFIELIGINGESASGLFDPDDDDRRRRKHNDDDDEDEEDEEEEEDEDDEDDEEDEEDEDDEDEEDEEDDS